LFFSLFLSYQDRIVSDRHFDSEPNSICFDTFYRITIMTKVFSNFSNVPIGTCPHHSYCDTIYKYFFFKQLANDGCHSLIKYILFFLESPLSFCIIVSVRSKTSCLVYHDKSGSCPVNSTDCVTISFFNIGMYVPNLPVLSAVVLLYFQTD